MLRSLRLKMSSWSFDAWMVDWKDRRTIVRTLIEQKDAHTLNQATGSLRLCIMHYNMSRGYDKSPNDPTQESTKIVRNLDITARHVILVVSWSGIVNSQTLWILCLYSSKTKEFAALLYRRIFKLIISSSDKVTVTNHHEGSGMWRYSASTACQGEWCLEGLKPLKLKSCVSFYSFVMISWVGNSMVRPS